MRGGQVTEVASSSSDWAGGTTPRPPGRVRHRITAAEGTRSIKEQE